MQDRPGKAGIKGHLPPGWSLGFADGHKALRHILPACIKYQKGKVGCAIEDGMEK